jgi:hypothetical protein
MADQEFWKRIRLRSRQTQLFLREAAVKIAGNEYRYLHVLVSIAHGQGIEITKWSGVKHWTSDRDCSFPLVVLVECCRLLGKDVLDYIPKEFAVLLWLHDVIDYPRLVSLRQIQPVLRLNELPTAKNLSLKVKLHC